jgi:hypothetical protein
MNERLLSRSLISASLELRSRLGYMEEEKEDQTIGKSWYSLKILNPNGFISLDAGITSETTNGNLLEVAPHSSKSALASVRLAPSIQLLHKELACLAS